MSAHNRAGFARIAFLALIALVSTLFATPAGAQSVEDVGLSDYMRIKTQKTSAVVIGDTAWVTVSLRGKRDIDDLRFTAYLENDEGTVAYPSNTVDHSGPYNGYQLDRRETDYVAFKVAIPADYGNNNIDLHFEATFTHNGRPKRGLDKVEVQLVEFDGRPYKLVSDDVSVSAATNGWVEVSFAGLAPRLETFEVVITDPLGLDVYYPRETFTSLNDDDLLEDGETDVVRFRLGEAHWTSATAAQIEVRYVFAGVPNRAVHKLTISPV